jgi:phosphomevalonate kinase
VLAARAAAERRWGAVPGALALDVRELNAGERKLGLGSSAAGAVAAAGVVAAWHGHDLASPKLRKDVFEAALQGHREVAPGGSGADVAASALGGFVRFRRLGQGLDAATDTRSLVWPAGLQTVVVWTGTVVRTSSMVAAVHALRERDPRAYGDCMDALALHAARTVTALEAAALAEVIACTKDYAGSMQALGEAAGVRIVDDTTAAIRSLAERAGGAAKPSGAGGGDVVLALFPAGEGVDVFRTGCISSGFHVLSLALGTVGGRVEEP